VRRLARLLLFLGIPVAVFGLGKLHATWNVYDYTGSFRFSWSATFVVVLWLCAYGVGLPELGPRRNRWASAIAASALGALTISAFQLFTGDALLPRFVVFGAAVLLVPWYVLCAVLASGAEARARGRERVIVVASAEEADVLGLELADRPERHAVIVDSLTAESAAARSERTLTRRATASNATVVVLGREAQIDDHIVEQAAELHQQGLRIRSLAAFYEVWLGKLPIAELERVSLMFDIGELHGWSYARVKRALDVVMASIAVVPSLLIVPVVMVGNLVANRGALLYRQRRVGRNGVEFTIVKFRTMQATDGADVNEWTTEDDPRITPFGRLLRRTHLDELPQLWNILRGDLSVVGPRPEQPHYVEQLVAKIPFYDLRHLVRPGLTGWAQVKYGYAGDESDAIQKLQYDFWYLRHQGLDVDLRILGRTLRDVVGAGGR
jgi:exopolysaccharide biosynthesis polyprenyl glycosylphosphotransferase